MKISFDVEDEALSERLLKEAKRLGCSIQQLSRHDVLDVEARFTLSFLKGDRDAVQWTTDDGRWTNPVNYRGEDIFRLERVTIGRVEPAWVMSHGVLILLVGTSPLLERRLTTIERDPTFPTLTFSARQSFIPKIRFSEPVPHSGSVEVVFSGVFEAQRD